MMTAVPWLEWSLEQFLEFLPSGIGFLVVEMVLESTLLTHTFIRNELLPVGQPLDTERWLLFAKSHSCPTSLQGCLQMTIGADDRLAQS